MKKILFFAAALTVMAGCTSNEFVGEAIETPVNGEMKAITFKSSGAPITRADYEDGDAATKLNYKFIVGGFKGATGTSTVFDGTTGAITTAGKPTTGMVYDNYQVKWVTNTANTTTSNTSDWEYVGLEFLAPSTLVNSDGVLQSIKYWDYAADQYDFIAYSTSDATVTTTGTAADAISGDKVLVTAIDAENASTKAYELSGSAANLQKCYIADMVTAYRADNDFQKEVKFKFRSLSAKVRLALYETIPGYSVKNVVFYSANDTKATDGKAYLYTTGTDVFNGAGTYTVSFPTIGYNNKANSDYNKAHVAFAAAASGTDNKKDFGALTGDLASGNFAAAEFKEAAISGSDKGYLGRESNKATYAGVKVDNYYSVVIPNETGAVLNLKVDYTLVSTDGSGETINVTGATAQVPAKFATWTSGYAYTYLFKISQNTNGVTNPSEGPAGLYPITFDAVVMNNEIDGIQETITTVATPSLTSYAKGAVVTGNNEYKTGANIYVIVENGTALTVGINANLYTVTLEDTDDTDAITTAAQTINEASVANALKQGGTVTDANKFKMTVTAAAATLNAVTEIAAEDAPDGNAITINGAVFKPAKADPSASPAVASQAGIYVFEYINGTDKYYKIIKVVE